MRREPTQDAPGLGGLVLTAGVEIDIALALKPTLGVPVRFAVADEEDGWHVHRLATGVYGNRLRRQAQS